MTQHYIERFRNTLLTLLAAVSFCGSLQAQQLRASLSHYSTDNGLASNAISNIIQDDYGYIWLATWNGVSRFDGYNFYNYQTGNASGVPNLHNRIFKLVKDNQQNIWMRMYDGRIFVIKRSEDRIINPFEGINGHEEFRTSYAPVVTSSGDVLVAVTEVGLYKLRIENDGVKSQFIATSGLEISSMAEGYQNDIWLGTNKGVHRMDVANLTIERKGMFLDESITCLYSNGYNIYAGAESGNIYSFAYGQEAQLVRKGSLPLNSVFVDSHGLVWFSDTQQGAYKLDLKTGQEKHFVQNIAVPDYGGEGGMFNETGGILWVRMNHGGYGYYNRATDEVEYFHNDPVNPWNLSNTVNAVLELSEGVVWESTSRRGLEKLEMLKNTISRQLLVPEAPQTRANEVRAMYYDRQRRLLLLGNKNSQLFIIRPDSSRTLITSDSRGHELGRIYGISRDSEGNYWVASKGQGLFKMTIGGAGGNTIQRFAHDDANPYSLSSDDVYLAVEDNDGNIWVATYGGGVNVLTRGKDGNPVFLHAKNAMKTYPSHSYKKVRTLALSKDGSIWAGTTDGVLILSLHDGKFNIQPLLPPIDNPKGTLGSNDIVCIACDRQGDMWVGSNGGGLAHTTGKDAQGHWVFESFGIAAGLPSEELMSFTFDSKGNIWFATDHVLCSYDVGKHIFTTFSNLDGVDETMCSEGAAVTLDGDNLLFGTINGYYVIDREKLSAAAGSKLKLRITDFWLNDELQSPRTSSNYDYYVPESRQVELPSHSAVTAFRFASLNYQLQHRVHYQYMLEGYDRKWHNADKSRMAIYSNLPTGHFRFKVRCFLLESPEKYDQRIIEVVVPPSFLLSQGSIWLYMVLIAAFGIWLMHWRQRQLMRLEKIRRMQQGPNEVEYQDEDEAAFMLLLMEWLEQNAVNSSLTVSDMIEATHLSERNYTEKLYQYTGLTPRELLSEYRLRKATEYLETSNDSIAEIALNSGFSDPTTFNRQFKAKMGVTPSQYRDEKQKKQEDETSPYEILGEE